MNNHSRPTPTHTYVLQTNIPTQQWYLSHHSYANQLIMIMILNYCYTLAREKLYCNESKLLNST